MRSRSTCLLRHRRLRLRSTPLCLASLSSSSLFRDIRSSLRHRIAWTTSLRCAEYNLLCGSEERPSELCILARASAYSLTYLLPRDRATFDPTLPVAVNYSVASPADAPASLTFGPPFITLASQLNSSVTLGLNRQLNNQSATLAAAVLSTQTMRNLYAIELGNEPECAFPEFEGADSYC